jgi:hypothetical protein
MKNFTIIQMLVLSSVAAQRPLIGDELVHDGGFEIAGTNLQGHCGFNGDSCVKKTVDVFGWHLPNRWDSATPDVELVTKTGEVEPMRLLGAPNSYFLDLNPRDQGEIYQKILDLDVAQDYMFSFYVNRNTECNGDAKSGFGAVVGTVAREEFTVTASEWMFIEIPFTATAKTHTIKITSSSPGDCGAVVDHVSIRARGIDPSLPVVDTPAPAPPVDRVIDTTNLVHDGGFEQAGSTATSAPCLPFCRRQG